MLSINEKTLEIFLEQNCFSGELLMLKICQSRNTIKRSNTYLLFCLIFRFSENYKTKKQRHPRII